MWRSVAGAVAVVVGVASFASLEAAEEEEAEEELEVEVVEAVGGSGENKWFFRSDMNHSAEHTAVQNRAENK